MQHQCVQNYPSQESSKSMKSAAILEMVVWACADCNVVVGWIVSDDDSVMRAHLRHKKDPDNNQDKG